jgi:hypothetical protein
VVLLLAAYGRDLVTPSRFVAAAEMRFANAYAAASARNCQSVALAFDS